MVVLDTNVLLEKVRNREKITEDITAVTLVEFPRILYYRKFYGSIIFPLKDDFLLASKIQLKLLELGKSQSFADLMIAAIYV